MDYIKRQRNTGIDIGLGVTCVVHLSGTKCTEVYRFGSKINPDLKKLTEATPLARYTAYAKYLDDHLTGIKVIGTIIMENPISTQIGNGMRLYTLRGSLLPVLGKYVEDPKMYHPTPTQIKRYWTGNGRADKEMMIETCTKKSHTPADDHEADAVAMANMGIDYNWTK